MARCGFCCSRRRWELGEYARALAAWVRLTLGAWRLARRRRLWAFLGHWLQEIKSRGRAAALTEAPRSKKRR